MSLEDPFFIVKTEVHKSLQNAKVLYSRWADLLDDPRSASKEEYEWTTTELKNSLRSIDWDLEDLDETISVVEKNPTKFKISDEELKERRTFVERMRTTIQEMRTHINSPEVKEKEDQKTKIQKRAESSQYYDKYQKLNREIEKSNQNFIDSAHQQQQVLINQQDEQLTHIGSSVSVLKHMSHNIGNEMDEQNRLLDDFTYEMDQTDSKMDSVMKKMAKVLHMSSDKRQWCAIVLLIVVLVIVIILFIVL